MKRVLFIAIMAALGVLLISGVSWAKSSGGGKPGTVSPPQATSCPDPNTGGPSKGRPTVKDCTPPPADADNDGVADTTDNCPNVANASQTDTDGDGKGDACDTQDNRDSDNDGVQNYQDQCANTSTGTVVDSTGCPVVVPPADADNDGVPDSTDNCVNVANTGQTDTDGDGLGDACDTQDNRDSDNDGVQNYQDDCPNVAGSTSNNGCPLPPPPADTDNDGVPDSTDNCVNVSNPNQADLDNDGLGDACDPDRDGDNFLNDGDACPDLWGPQTTPRGGPGDGCPIIIPIADSDGDGIGDNADLCPEVAGPAENGGCPYTVEQDPDMDGVPIGQDLCPDVYGTVYQGCTTAPPGNTSYPTEEQLATCTPGEIIPIPDPYYTLRKDPTTGDYYWAEWRSWSGAGHAFVYTICPYPS